MELNPNFGKRVTGIEPVTTTWKDGMLPLHHTRTSCSLQEDRHKQECLHQEHLSQKKEHLRTLHY